jgi:hypothetical protein
MGIPVFFFSSSLLPLWSRGLISQFLDHSQTAGLLERVISSSQGLYLNTEKRAHTSNIHALSGIRTHDPGLRASEDSTCLRQLGYRDRQSLAYKIENKTRELYWYGRRVDRLYEWNVDGTGSGSFIVVGFAISGVASSSSTNRELVNAMYCM